MEEIAVCIPDHGEAQQYVEKSGWPEVEKDVSPSGMIPAGQKCIQKHLKKLGLLQSRFEDAKKLTDLQEKSLC